jgi:hypothetical protein
MEYEIWLCMKLPYENQFSDSDSNSDFVYFRIYRLRFRNSFDCETCFRSPRLQCFGRDVDGQFFSLDIALFSALELMGIRTMMAA